MGRPDVTLSSADGAKGSVKAGDESTLADLEAGQQVTVSAPEGGTAESIMVMPKKGEMIGAPMVGRCRLRSGQRLRQLADPKACFGWACAWGGRPPVAAGAE